MQPPLALRQQPSAERHPSLLTDQWPSVDSPPIPCTLCHEVPNWAPQLYWTGHNDKRGQEGGRRERSRAKTTNSRAVQQADTQRGEDVGGRQRGAQRDHRHQCSSFGSPSPSPCPRRPIFGSQTASSCPPSCNTLLQPPANASKSTSFAAPEQHNAHAFGSQDACPGPHCLPQNFAWLGPGGHEGEHAQRQTEHE